MAEIVNLLSRVLTSNPLVQTGAVTQTKRSNNPFAQSSGNPFVSSNPFAQSSGNPFVSSNPFANYGQNKPVAGGYFAGYYNNQPNIVGRRLFIEV